MTFLGARLPVSQDLFLQETVFMASQVMMQPGAPAEIAHLPGNWPPQGQWRYDALFGQYTGDETIQSSVLPGLTIKTRQLFNA
jgi:hypothetical protein